MKTIDVLLSTHSNKIFSAFELIEKIPVTSGVFYIVVHQDVQPLSEVDLLPMMSRGDFKYIHSHDRGVTKSRNIALKNSTSDIVLFADDDIELSHNFYEIIRNAYLAFSGFVTFQVGVSGHHFNDNYRQSRFKSVSFTHNKFSILSVGTIEVTVDRASISKLPHYFPEDMGAGATYPACDEPVFLAKLLDSKVSGLYMPDVICKHPAFSSGLDLDGAFLAARGVAFYRIFGPAIGLLMLLIFVFKRRLYRSGQLIKNVKLLLSGWSYANKQ